MNKFMNKVLVLVLVLMTLVGCTTGVNEQTKTATVEEVVTAIKEAYGDDYVPNFEIGAEFLEAEFGLTSEMIEEVFAEQPMISVHADRLVVVKAAEGQADAVEAALIATKEAKVNDTFQYPNNIAKINAAQIIRHGDIVVFLMVGAVNESADMTEQEAKEFAENEIQKGVVAINDLFE